MNKFLILPFASKISDLSNYQYDEIGPTGHYHLVIDSLGTFELAPNANNPLHSGGVLEVLFTFKPKSGDSEDFYVFSLIGNPFFLPYAFGIEDSGEKFDGAAKLYLTYVERYFETTHSRLHFLNIRGNSFYQGLC